MLVAVAGDIGDIVGSPEFNIDDVIIHKPYVDNNVDVMADVVEKSRLLAKFNVF